MVTIGVDCHKRSHTLVAVDGNGRQLAAKTVEASDAGHLQAVAWAREWQQRVWALENCRHVSRRLEADLLRAGEQVLQVSPKLMAGARRTARTAGKSDPIDALAVARAALREPDLPVARLEGASREVRLLVDHREDLVAERTRCQNRLHWSLLELVPEFEQGLAAGALSSFRTLDEIEARLAGAAGVEVDVARVLVAQIRWLTQQANALEKEIARRTAELAPTLLAMPGCGALTAGKILGEVADLNRFRSRAAFARHNGTAPIPVWSGDSQHVRLNRGGNRQLNAALHRIAITQLRLRGPGWDYVQKCLAGGNTKKGALRLLRRRLSDEVYRRLLIDARARQAGSSIAA